MPKKTRFGNMEVICPSYGRTGTNSLQVALEILGFGPSYHMFKVVDTHMETHPQLWLDGYQGRGLPVKKIFDGYKSVTDWPAANFYKDIIKEYPNAKVVVTLRDPDSWWKSLRSTIHVKSGHIEGWGTFFMVALKPAFRRWLYMGTHITTVSAREEEAKADYIHHNAEVKAHVPADKLLEFSVKDGWEPLCTFLGVPVPDIPFPKMNSREEITRRFRGWNTAGWVRLFMVMAAAGMSIWVASWLGGNHAGGVVAAIEVCVISYCFVEAVRIFPPPTKV